MILHILRELHAKNSFSIRSSEAEHPSVSVSDFSVLLFVNPSSCSRIYITNYQSRSWPTTKHNYPPKKSGVEVNYIAYLYQILAPNSVIIQFLYVGEQIGGF